jgi:hypothetical protein
VEYVIETDETEIVYRADELANFRLAEPTVVHATQNDGTIDVWFNVQRWYLREATP